MFYRNADGEFTTDTPMSARQLKNAHRWLKAAKLPFQLKAPLIPDHQMPANRVDDPCSDTSLETSSTSDSMESLPTIPPDSPPDSPLPTEHTNVEELLSENDEGEAPAPKKRTNSRGKPAPAKAKTKPKRKGGKKSKKAQGSARKKPDTKKAASPEATASAISSHAQPQLPCTQDFTREWEQLLGIDSLEQYLDERITSEGITCAEQRQRVLDLCSQVRRDFYRWEFRLADEQSHCEYLESAGVSFGRRFQKMMYCKVHEKEGLKATLEQMVERMNAASPLFVRDGGNPKMQQQIIFSHINPDDLPCLKKLLAPKDRTPTEEEKLAARISIRLIVSLLTYTRMYNFMRELKGYSVAVNRALEICSPANQELLQGIRSRLFYSIIDLSTEQDDAISRGLSSSLNLLLETANEGLKGFEAEFKWREENYADYFTACFHISKLLSRADRSYRTHIEAEFAKIPRATRVRFESAKDDLDKLAAGNHPAIITGAKRTSVISQLIGGMQDRLIETEVRAVVQHFENIYEALAQES